MNCSWVSRLVFILWNGLPLHPNRYFFGQPRQIGGVHEVQLLAIDLGKQSFHIHGITDGGEVISKKVSRSKLEVTVLKLAPQTLVMETCASAPVRIIEAGSSKLWGAAFDTFIPVSLNPLSKVPRMTRLMPKRFIRLQIVR